MKQSLIPFAIAGALCAAGVVLAADMPGMDMPTTAPTSQPAADAPAVDLGNTLCPISGNKVGHSTVTATYDGKIYHFCCAGCTKTFGEDAAKYAKAVAADPAKYGVKAPQ